jgi:hypothetical protein
MVSSWFLKLSHEVNDLCSCKLKADLRATSDLVPPDLRAEEWHQASMLSSSTDTFPDTFAPGHQRSPAN